MQDTIEEILEETKTLTPEQQKTLLEALNLFLMAGEFIEIMKIMEKALTLMPDDMRRLRDEINSVEHDIAGSEGRAQLTRSVRGKYAHLPTGSEAFAARKSEEVRLEDRRSRA